MTALGARLLGAFVTEHAENSFPRLPVRAGENVFISVTGFDSAEAHARHEAALAASPKWQAFQQAAQLGHHQTNGNIASVADLAIAAAVAPRIRPMTRICR